MTRNVKAMERRPPPRIETPVGERYKLRVSTARISGRIALAFAALAALGAAACEKKQPTATGAAGAVAAADRAGASAAPVDTTPLPGLDVSKLTPELAKRFYQLVDSLGSPCGKAHSLRTSVATDTSCKRAPFAARYVLALVEDQATEEQARQQYAARYDAKAAPVKIDTSKAPRVGNDDAPVRLVEFFDYACHACQAFKPVLDKVIEEHGSRVVVYFMNYPLGKWPDSRSAGQAAIAAAAQGKFKEMHAMLFERSPAHGRDAVLAHAKELGLDLTAFAAAYEAAGAQVDSDRQQGDVAGVQSTPTLFFNDRRYDGPQTPKYIGMWIEEEVAVNR
jgi:protein-disulfide isomerase